MTSTTANDPAKPNALDFSRQLGALAANYATVDRLSLLRRRLQGDRQREAERTFRAHTFIRAD
jgi:hypothetical protein